MAHSQTRKTLSVLGVKIRSWYFHQLIMRKIKACGHHGEENLSHNLFRLLRRLAKTSKQSILQKSEKFTSMNWVGEVALRNCMRENQTISYRFWMSIIKYSDGTFRIPCICHHQRMSFQTTAYLQNSCECERQVILMASAMAFPPTVCAQWPVGNTPRLTYSHSSGYLHIFAHTTLHRSVVRKRKKVVFIHVCYSKAILLTWKGFPFTSLFFECKGLDRDLFL